MPVELKVPTVGESVSEVQIGEWLKPVGARARQDEPVVTLDSEKTTMEVPSPVNGTITQVLKQPGETARVGEVIALIEEGPGSAAEAAEPAPEWDKPQAPPVQRAGLEPAAAAPGIGGVLGTPDKTSSDGTVPAGSETNRSGALARDSARIMPAAERVMAQAGLKPEDVSATGPGGRVLKSDAVEAAVKVVHQPEPHSGAAPGEEEVVPMTLLRRRVAEHLVQAQQNAALLTTFNEIDMSAVMDLRRQYQEQFQKKYNIKLGFMSFFVKAAVDALKQIPGVNAEIRDTNIVYRNYFDIGVAIGGGRGLVVPVVRRAERLSFAEIEVTIAEFARRAKENKLLPDELAGGTFTITNGGIYGSLLSTPIVNPPQSGILGMHAIQERPVALNGQVVIKPMMYVALTYDHRIVDGREAVTFLVRLKECIENPARMMMEV